MQLKRSRESRATYKSWKVFEGNFAEASVIASFKCQRSYQNVQPPCLPTLTNPQETVSLSVYINARILCKISTKSRISTEKHVLGQRMSRKSCYTQVNYHAAWTLGWTGVHMLCILWLKWTRPEVPRFSWPPKKWIEKVKDSTFTLP